MSYRIPKHILLQSVGEEKVMLDPESGVYFTLDPIGARMLDLLQTLGSVDAVVGNVVIEYEVEHGQARDDLGRLLGELCEHGLLEADFDAP